MTGTQKSIVSGRCLCGAVSFSAQAKSHDVSVCHCSMCNRWSGGVSMFMEVVGAPAFDGQDKIGLYRSSEWGERGFCKVCGSSLFWKLVGEDRYTLSAGCLDDQSPLHFALEIFIDDKPEHYSFANETVKQTGEEAMAAYTVSSNKD
jgi:hypothetical protein